MENLPHPIQVEFVYLPVINFSMQQNRVPVIRELSIQNTSDQYLGNMQVSLECEPDFGYSEDYLIESIAPGSKHTVNIQFPLSASFFSEITERVAGNIRIVMKRNAETIYEKSFPMEALPFDQWSGISVLPEMLSAFVTPNSPALLPLIKRTSDILLEWTGDPSLDGYQSQQPNRTRKQIAAVYSAISELEITYCSAPVSFEEQGQRVRLAGNVIADKMGNCLDMCLLFASCLEAIGIHPLIVLIQGHAFAGGWIVPETYPDSITDDISQLTKRVADGIHDVVLAEMTGMNKGNRMEFEQSAIQAKAHLSDESKFTHLLDVKRARNAGIRPLPQRVFRDQNWQFEEEPNYFWANIPEDMERFDLNTDNEPVEVTKKLLWERKLLDLSLRNNLLNIRITKSTLQLISAHVDELEDELAAGEEFSILPKPNDWENPLYDFGIYHSLTGKDPVLNLIRSELSQKRLRSYLSENDLAKSLLYLYRSSRVSLEENGANTLYLAIGLLKWYESPGSERTRYAPILLVPVEMIRKSSAKGFVIRTREEETMLNITLLEMLRQNFNISINNLLPLPTDDSGVNVKLVFSIIRKSIMDQKGWDVEEQAILGIFSFNKFIMWNDIHNNTDKLLQSEIVSSLISGKINWEIPEEEAEEMDLDREIKPHEILLPISADASQLDAIYESGQGKSFVLHGPPGTGKSQTITNIIANALYQGKRVLFVAEKMAALTVVQSRLEKLGLAPFCLELHSNKTKKSNVLAQLKQTTDVSRQRTPEGFARHAESIHKTREALNKYVEDLHQKYTFGFSLYEAIHGYLSLKTEKVLKIPPGYIDTLTEEQLYDINDCLEALVGFGNAFGHPATHPLSGMHIEKYDSVLKEEVSITLEEIIRLTQALKRLLEAFPLTRDMPFSREVLNLISEMVDSLSGLPDLNPALLNPAIYLQIAEEYKEVIEHGRERDKRRKEILSTFRKEILTFDTRPLFHEWNVCNTKWFLPRYFGQNRIRKILNSYVNATPVTKQQIPAMFHLLNAYREEKEYVEKYQSDFRKYFGRSARAENEDWDTISAIIEKTGNLNYLISVYESKHEQGLRKLFTDTFREGWKSFLLAQGDNLKELKQTFADLKQRISSLSDKVRFEEESGNDESPRWLEHRISQLQNWFANLDKLKDWYHWHLIMQRLRNRGIGFVAEQYQKEHIPTENITARFKKGLYLTATQHILSRNPELEFFNGAVFEETIRKFKKLTAEFEGLTRRELFARLASGIPSFTKEATQSSEVGILQKNIRNRGRGISIRKLFDSIPTLLPRLCPCMLMSPISVAQYIDPEADKFDLVIFDEASQMPTCEAVGAIARGKNVITVGDPKQMPPTSFFAVNTYDEDNYEIEDLESILDDCLALSFPSKYLLWHYRSRHESLIAFSNAEYYDGKLKTFPSPDNIESKVRFIPIEGYYDKGKSRQNRAEAEAVMQEVIRRLSDPKLRNKSIGIVTFSATQQTLIEDILSEAFIKYSKLENWAYNSPEPLFVKNLENVQGDERDIILFSIGYGPDKEGKVSMNFGPLNRDGGERRLNVAVSRARQEMHIFSTLHSDQIDLKRTSAVGVAGLKRFLEYAEKGRLTTAPAPQPQGSEQAALLTMIASEIEKAGYEVHTHIGCSGYKIDLGVVDKRKSSRYLLGVICDGENYRHMKTARDREITQNEVLHSLGWNIYRIWTMELWEKFDETVSLLIKKIKQCESLPLHGEPQEIPRTNMPSIQTEEEKAEEDAFSAQSPSEEPCFASKAVPYKQVNLPVVRYSTDEFYDPNRQNYILNQIRKVMEAEAPISRQLVCKRILRAWAITRMGTKLDSYFDELFRKSDLFITEEENRTFLWKDKEQFDHYDIYRIGSERDAPDLPPVEVAVAIREILEEQIGMPLTDLIKITAQRFGFARCGTHVEIAIRAGVRRVVEVDKLARIENDKITII